MATETTEAIESTEVVDAPPVVDPAAPADPAPVADPVDPAPPAVEAPKPPVEYKLVLPKDSALPVASIEKTAAIARKLGLSNEAAQEVLDSFNATLAADAKADAEAWKPNTGSSWKARDAEWKAEALKDTEIGGTPDKLSANVNTANLVLSRFFDPSVVEFLRESGLGSHREFIRGLARIGKGMSEGTMHTGGAPAQTAPKTQAEILYGGTSAKSAAA